jgi:L-alanine-DL-glutamate epimerase-like enolase superfamily enzyme
MTDADTDVTALRATAYTVPTDRREADGTLSWDSTTVVVVQVTGAGHHGLGWSYTGSAAVSVVHDLLTAAVVGGSVFDPAAANDRMSRAVRNVGRRGIAASAISAVDVALWDLKARVLGLPLSRLLGSVRDSVPVYGSGGFTTYDDKQTCEQLEGWIDECGVDAVKIKIGESWGSCIERDLARTALARDVIGPDRQLFVDANGAYSVGTATRVGHALEELGVTWFEEPVSPDDLDGLRQVRASITPDVSAGEYGWDLSYFRRMLTAGAVDCLQIDATRCGGITDFLRAAAVAAAHNVEVSAHCAPHLHVAVAAAVPNLRHLEYFHDHIRIEEQLLFDGCDPARNGVLPVCQGRCGLGIEFRHEAVDKLRVA